MDFAHVADGAGPDVFDGGARVVQGMPLVAHLRGNLGVFGAARELASFFDRPADRLLHIDMLAQSHGGQGNRCVHVVRRGDHDGVDVLLVLEHIAIVLIALRSRQMVGLELDHGIEPRLRLYAIEPHGRLSRARRWRRLIDARAQVLDVGVEPIERLAGIAPVHVAQRHDVLAGEVDQVIAAHAADANAGDVQRVARRSESTPEDAPWHDGKRGTARGGVGQKPAPRDFFLFVLFLCDRPDSIGVNAAVNFFAHELPPWATDLGLRNRCGGFVRVDTLAAPGVHCPSHVIIVRMVLHVQIVIYEAFNERRIDFLVSGPFHCAPVNVVADDSRCTGLPGQRHPMGVPWES